MSTNHFPARQLLVVIVLTLADLSHANAASPYASSRPLTPPIAVSPGPLLAESVSWSAFKRYWTNVFYRGDRVVLAGAAVMILALFIITRGKWRT
jgi:hypothetical protein